MKEKPDFKKAYILANELLVAAHCIKGFPYNVKELVKEQTDLVFCTFKKAYEKYGVDCHAFGSKSAFFANVKGRCFIFYNQDEYDARKPFNQLHETGHFLLEHKTNLDKNDPLYGIQEVETNFFASQLLMPEQVIKEIQKRLYKVDENFLTKNFGVSGKAAKKRLETLGKVHRHSPEEKLFDDIIIARYMNFINKVAPKKSCWSLEDEYEKQKERDSWY